jgi:hypothetical protein
MRARAGPTGSALSQSLARVTCPSSRPHPCDVGVGRAGRRRPRQEGKKQTAAAGARFHRHTTSNSLTLPTAQHATRTRRLEGGRLVGDGVGGCVEDGHGCGKARAKIEKRRRPTRRRSDCVGAGRPRFFSVLPRGACGKEKRVCARVSSVRTQPGPFAPRHTQALLACALGKKKAAGSLSEH